MARMSPKDVVKALRRSTARTSKRSRTSIEKTPQFAEKPVEGRDAIREMFAAGFAAAEMVCIPEHIFEDGNWAIFEWCDLWGLRGCGFFHIVGDKVVFQRGYWDKLTFLRLYGLALPKSAT